MMMEMRREGVGRGRRSSSASLFSMDGEGRSIPFSFTPQGTTQPRHKLGITSLGSYAS